MSQGEKIAKENAAFSEKVPSTQDQFEYSKQVQPRIKHYKMIGDNDEWYLFPASEEDSTFKKGTFNNDLFVKKEVDIERVDVATFLIADDVRTQDRMVRGYITYCVDGKTKTFYKHIDWDLKDPVTKAVDASVQENLLFRTNADGVCHEIDLYRSDAISFENLFAGWSVHRYVDPYDPRLDEIPPPSKCNVWLDELPIKTFTINIKIDGKWKKVNGIIDGSKRKLILVDAFCLKNINKGEVLPKTKEQNGKILLLDWEDPSSGKVWRFDKNGLLDESQVISDEIFKTEHIIFPDRPAVAVIKDTWRS